MCLKEHSGVGGVLHFFPGCNIFFDSFLSDFCTVGILATLCIIVLVAFGTWITLADVYYFGWFKDEMKKTRVNGQIPP